MRLNNFQMDEAIKHAENAMGVIKSYRNILKKAKELGYNVDIDHEYIELLRDISLETAVQVGPFLKDTRF